MRGFGTIQRLRRDGEPWDEDADQESDVDLLVELDIECLTFSDKRTIRRLVGEVSLAHGLVLSVLAVDRSAVRERGDFSIFVTIKEEGIPL